MVANLKTLLLLLLLSSLGTTSASRPYLGSGVLFSAGDPQSATQSMKPTSIELDATQQAQAMQTVRILHENPRVVVGIEGHTDSAECEHSACIALSVRRARMVAEFLRSRQVGAARIGIVRGYGSARPLVPTVAGSNAPENRRVEIVFSGFLPDGD